MKTKLTKITPARVLITVNKETHTVCHLRGLNLYCRPLGAHFLRRDGLWKDLREWGCLQHRHGKLLPAPHPLFQQRRRSCPLLHVDFCYGRQTAGPAHYQLVQWPVDSTYRCFTQGNGEPACFHRHRRQHGGCSSGSFFEYLSRNIDSTYRRFGRCD